MPKTPPSGYRRWVCPSRRKAFGIKDSRRDPETCPNCGAEQESRVVFAEIAKTHTKSLTKSNQQALRTAKTNRVALIVISAAVGGMGALVLAALSVWWFASVEPSARQRQPAMNTGYVWEREVRPYDVLEVYETDDPWIGAIRSVTVVYATEDKDALRQALEEIYNELKRDIELTSPNLTLKRVDVGIYFEKREPGHGMAMASVSNRSAGDEMVPDFSDLPEAEFPGFWITVRKPESMPSELKRQIVHDYCDAEDAAYDVVPQTAVTGREAIEEFKQLRAEQKRRTPLVLQSYGIDEAEFDQICKEIWAWQRGE